MTGASDRPAPTETVLSDSGSDHRPGPATEEAAKLLGSLAGWVNDRIATGDAECSICPVCMLIRGVRDMNPDVVRHLAIAGWSLAAAARAFIDGAAQAGRPSDAETGSEGGPVGRTDEATRYGSSGHWRGPTRIDIAGEGND